jgi:peptidoglycan/LPS O-acetylase OafA/YrhL
MTDAPAETESPPPAPARFDALQSCRGLLAVLVVVYHLTAATHFHAYIANAYAAVDFFFVLSGFVIAAAYGRRIHTPGDLARYGVRRVGRLYPLHIAMLAIWLVIEFAKAGTGQPAFVGETSWPAFWASVTLTHAFSDYAITWNYPSWSIAIEFWANLGAGLVLLVFGRRWPLGVAIATLALVGFFFSELWVDYGDAQHAFDILSNDADYAIGFCLGMLAYPVYEAAARAGLRPPQGLDVLAVVATVAVFRFAPQAPALTKTLVFTLVVLVLAFERGPAAWVLTRRPLLRLGTISYSIYLTHALFVGLATEAIYWVADRSGQTVSRPMGGEDVIIIGGPWVLDAVAIALVMVTVAFSELTYRLIEDPARALFNRLSRLGTSRPQ